MWKVFPFVIAIEFFIASVICAIEKKHSHAWFYFFSGAINLTVLFM